MYSDNVRSFDYFISLDVIFSIDMFLVLSLANKVPCTQVSSINTLVSLNVISKLRDTEFWDCTGLKVINQTFSFQGGLCRTQECDALAILLKVLKEESCNFLAVFFTEATGTNVNSFFKDCNYLAISIWNNTIEVL